jgi:5-methylcytosine-specific restriction endonuclease McrA
MSGKWKSRDGEHVEHGLTAEFYRLRPKVLARASYSCENTRIDCERATPRGRAEAVVHVCGQYANQVDHINGDEDTLENLRALCVDCHKSRSSAQGNAGRWQYREARTRERHPGIKYDD